MGFLSYPLTTDKRKLGLRLSGMLEVGVPGSMGEGQKEGFSVGSWIYSMPGLPKAVWLEIM